MKQDAFHSLSPFLQDYIYRNHWEELRAVQVAACEVIFDTDDHLLLSSGTASGKTEAAFLPALTVLEQQGSSSVGILYISPLKALINDQFYRLDDLLRSANIAVTKWHGDVAASVKQRLLRNPQGVMQTTPESLEAMLMRRGETVETLFGDLKFIIIDEVHYFMESERGAQLLCVLERICRIAGCNPRRIGLSATLGDYGDAKRWICSGTKRGCTVPVLPPEKKKLRLSVSSFPIASPKEKEQRQQDMKAYYQYLYRTTLGKKCIVFCNSKSDVELTVGHLKRFARNHNTPDVYYVHHGSVSASLREYTEQKMKNSTLPIVTGATVTLELGIDIGELERIVQTGSPYTVSSFVQRLGRAGRRGGTSEMWFAFRQEEKEQSGIKRINWDFLKCLALIELYVGEKWIEPVLCTSLPYGLLYHQTMSCLASAGGMKPNRLAQEILTLTPFSHITQEDFRTLLLFLLEKEQIETCEDGSLLVGSQGERETENFEFFAVFDAKEEYTVRCEAEEIGSVQNAFPVGARFALGGRSWEVVSVSKKNRELKVKPSTGVLGNVWDNEVRQILHTKVMCKIKEILQSDALYGYLTQSAKDALLSFRRIAREEGILSGMVVPMGQETVGIFPWLGSNAIAALYYYLKQEGFQVGVYESYEMPVCVLTYQTTETVVIGALRKLKEQGADKYRFQIPNRAVMPGKFNAFVPGELLKKQFIEDYLDVEELRGHLQF